MNWRDPKAQMSVEQRAKALNAHQYNTFDDDEQLKEYIGELAAFGHACAAAAERERDAAIEQRDVALSQLDKAASGGPQAMNLDNYIATPGRETRDTLRSQLYEMERRADSAEAALYQARAERDALLAALRDAVALLDNRDRGFDPTVCIGDLRRQVIHADDQAIAAAEGKG